MDALEPTAGPLAVRPHATVVRVLIAVRRTLGSLVPARARFGRVFTHSLIGMAELKADATVLDANAALGRFVGVDHLDLVGCRLTDFSPPEHACVVEAVIADVANGTRPNAGTEVRFVRPDGQTAWGALTVWRATSRGRSRLLATVYDVSERKSLEAELFHKAFHDNLTGLPNRALFRQNVEHALARTARHPGALSVLLVDVDNLKAFNDAKGHGTGDRLLKLASDRLRHAARGCDAVARVGGDEFAVLIEAGAADDGAEVVAQRILEALQQPIDFADSSPVTLTASIGIATYQGTEGTDELLRNAGVALDAAKRRARGQWLQYEPAMHAAILDRVTMEADLRRAIEQSELGVVFQPIVDLETKRLTGVEALARWKHPDRGAVGPTTFIPLAEESGFIHALGGWVLHEACQQAAAWNQGRSEPLTMTVNVSGLQLERDDLAAEVKEALRTSGLPPELLVLEITESAIMRTMGRTLSRLNGLKRLGVRLAIDDFGTGYSSLSYLQQFPVDILKIDRSFVERLLRGPNESALVRTIVALARILGLRTIAEGVDDERQRRQLTSLGCDAAQGFLFGRPMSAEAIEPLIEAGVVRLKRRGRGAPATTEVLARR